MPALPTVALLERPLYRLLSGRAVVVVDAVNRARILDAFGPAIALRDDWIASLDDRVETTGETVTFVQGVTTGDIIEWYEES